MYCVNCGTTWEDIEGVIYPSKCPFCGFDRLNCKNNLALKYVVDEFGMNIFDEQKRLFCILNDILGHRPEELASIKLLEMQKFHEFYKKSVEASNVYEQRRELIKAKNLMSDLGFKKTRINTIDAMYRIAFGIDEPRYSKTTYKDQDSGYLLLAEQYAEEEDFETAVKISDISADTGSNEAIDKLLFYNFRWNKKVKKEEAIEIINNKEILSVAKESKYKKILKQYNKSEYKSIYMEVKLYWFCLLTNDYKNGLAFFENVPGKIEMLEKDYRLLAYIYDSDEYGHKNTEKALMYAEKDIEINCFLNDDLKSSNYKKNLIDKSIYSIENSIIIYLKKIGENFEFNCLNYKKVKYLFQIFSINNLKCLKINDLQAILIAWYNLVALTAIYGHESIVQIYHETKRIKTHITQKNNISADIPEEFIEESIRGIDNILNILSGGVIAFQYEYIYGNGTFNNIKFSIQILKENPYAIKYVVKKNTDEFMKGFWNEFGIHLYEKWSQKNEYEATDILELLEIGRKQGDAVCSYLESKMYFEGNGIEQDKDKATELFINNRVMDKLYADAYENNIHNAYYCLGEIFAMGYFVEQDMELAKDYFIYCAQRGESEAEEWLNKNLIDVDLINGET